ncbi:DUF3299 domain-containing protein [Paraferrimonas sedimenticola]|uniref:DUF3299 domain-containing protein n=1 Tax=Paraferrimonas sedimenticola TaxID=375674 RepID=A0AA37RR75_9GAMM|nr:DUF3299 domain-containing protein [Paraferrimonas sedimenticola]GLP94936.1 hypothetical protein GCM10007895_02420 [Paraferrimonas sedimenticola]
MLTKFMKVILFFSLVSTSANAATTLSWDDLVPKEDLVFTRMVMKQPVEHEGQEFAPQPVDEPLLRTVGELDGKMVKLPGYLVPVVGDDEQITAFILVPGAESCGHEPPPPPNQIVYVEPEKALPMQWYIDPIWIVGVMQIEEVETDRAKASYRMSKAQILSFSDGSD